MVGGFESRSIASTAMVVFGIVQLALGSDGLILGFGCGWRLTCSFFFFSGWRMGREGGGVGGVEDCLFGRLWRSC